MRASKPDFLSVRRWRRILGIRAQSAVGVLGEKLDTKLMQREGVTEVANMLHAVCGAGEVLVSHEADGRNGVPATWSAANSENT